MVLECSSCLYFPSRNCSGSGNCIVRRESITDGGGDLETCCCLSCEGHIFVLFFPLDKPHKNVLKKNNEEKIDLQKAAHLPLCLQPSAKKSWILAKQSLRVSEGKCVYSVYFGHLSVLTLSLTPWRQENSGKPASAQTSSLPREEGNKKIETLSPREKANFAALPHLTHTSPPPPPPPLSLCGTSNLLPTAVLKLANRRRRRFWDVRNLQ